jgi:hypothetical protein
MVAGIGQRSSGALVDVDGVGAGAVDSFAGGIQLLLQPVADLAVEAAPQPGDDRRGGTGDDEACRSGIRRISPDRSTRTSSPGLG